MTASAWVRGVCIVAIHVKNSRNIFSFGKDAAAAFNSFDFLEKSHYFAVFVNVDDFCGRNFGQSGHCENIAEIAYDEACA